MSAQSMATTEQSEPDPPTPAPGLRGLLLGDWNVAMDGLFRRWHDRQERDGVSDKEMVLLIDRGYGDTVSEHYEEWLASG